MNIQSARPDGRAGQGPRGDAGPGMRSLHERNGLDMAGSEAVTLVDAHHHLWSLDTHRYPWLQEAYDPHSFMGDHRCLRRNYLAADYLRDAARHRVLATVHCEAEHDRGDPVAETAWLHWHHARHGFPNAVVAYADLTAPDCEDLLLRHRAFALVRGIRCKPLTAPRPGTSVKGLPRSLQDESWLRGLALLEKYGLSWDLRVPFWHLAEAAELAAAFPQLRIVLNHTGLPWDRSAEGLAAWRKGMEALAARPNVHLKVSELGVPERAWTVEGNRQVVCDAIDMFGVARCMFASNVPVSGLHAGFDTIVRGMKAIVADLPEEQQHDFFWRNALRFYRIEFEQP